MTNRSAGVAEGLPKGKEDLDWVTTATLIYGEREAVLVDTYLFVKDSVVLLDSLADSGKISQPFASLPTVAGTRARSHRSSVRPHGPEF